MTNQAQAPLEDSGAKRQRQQEERSEANWGKWNSATNRYEKQAAAQPVATVTATPGASVIDFDSDVPLECPMRQPGEFGTCESCQ